MKTNIVSKTVQGLKWNYVSVFLTSIFQLIHLAIMSRLLDQADFGLLAMAETILRFGVYFSRMGIGPAIIQKKDLSENDIRAGFTLSVLLSLFVTMVIFFAAPLAKLIFNSTEVIPVVQAYAFTMFIAGINTVSVSLLQRTFRFRELFIAETISYFIGAMVVGISLAYLGLGVWSLIIASLVQGLILTVITYGFTRHSLRPLFSLSHFKPLLSFGGRLSLISFIEYFSHNLDTFVIGHYFSAALLGVYNQANRLINLPSQKISTSLIKVLFSTFSDIQNDLPKLRKAHLLSIEVLGLVIFPFAFSISGAANEVVLVLLGSKWIDAIPVLRVLAIAVPFFLVNSINGVLFEAKSWLNVRMILVVLRLILIVVLISLLYQFGLLGIAVSILILSISYYIVFLWVAQKKLSEQPSQIIKVTLRIVGSGLIALALTWSTSILMNRLGINHYITFIVEILLGGLVLGFFTYLKPPKQMILFINQYLMNKDYSKNPFIEKWVKARYQKLYSRLFYTKQPD